jgi:PAS domain S-box-containing protein
MGLTALHAAGPPRVDRRRDIRCLGAGCTLLVLLAIAATALAITAPRQWGALTAATWVQHTHDVNESAAAFLAAAQDAEADGLSLPTGLRRVWHAFADVQRFTTAHPSQQEHLQALSGLLRDWLALIQQNGTPPRDIESRQIMTAIRQLTSAVVDEEQRLVEQRRDDEQNIERQIASFATGLSVAAAIGVLLCGMALTKALTASLVMAHDAAVAAERRRLLDTIDLAALMVRDLDGTIRFWSEGCRRLYGWTAQEAIGQSVQALLHTVFPVPLSEIEAALLRDGEWYGELHQRTQGGVDVIVAVHKVLNRDADGRYAVMASATNATALHQAEGRLRESRAQFQAVVETAAEGIVVADADGRLLSVNSALLRMFGYDRAEELIGRDVGVLMPPDDAEQHRVHIAALKAGAPPRVVGVPGRELVALHRDGSEFTIDLSMTSFGHNGQRLLTGIMRDATARKQAEASLRDSEARLRLVQQIGEIGSTDRSISDEEAVISAEYVRIYGLPPGQTHISLPAWLALAHPEDRDQLDARMRDLREHGDSLTWKFRICRPDGSVRWIAIRGEAFLGPDGKPLRIITAQQDITEIMAARAALESRQERLEQRVAKRTAALAKAEAQFHAIFDSQFSFIGLLAPDGTVLEVNRTALDAAAQAREDVVGKLFWETPWWAAAERDRLRRDIAEAAHGRLIRREVENIGAAGRIFWVDFSLKPVRNPLTGAVMWIIAEGRDLTEKRELTSKLVQAQKVQALGQLAGGIAHDFNNILQTVSGAAMLIERRPENHEKTRRLARTSIEAAARGASITQRLLSFTRRGEPRTDTIATAELLNSVREVLAHTIGTAISVHTDTPAGLPPVLADRAQLETVLVNLATNGRDAMPDGGTLTLSADAVHVAEGSTHPAGLLPGDYLRIRVADTGCGMDAVTLARATEPFFTTKSDGQGTGLGLAMVKGFAEQSGGAMLITSAPNAGTTVSLWLRQALDDILRRPVQETGGRLAGSAAARILLVDDDDLLRETLAAQFEDMGFGTLVAANGHEALSLIEAGEIVDAMVSDLSMPGMNGVVTIQKARALRPRLPCFLLTGYVGERAALSADDAFTLIRKPVSIRALAAQIEAGLEAAARH